MDRVENTEEMNHLTLNECKIMLGLQTDPWASHGVHLLIILSE